MANPKRKWSKARTGTRRSQWKLSVPGLVDCPKCHTLKMPHKVCKNCGFYDGKEIVKMGEEKKAK
jgi:large subunit ribosomal protein L32